MECSGFVGAKGMSASKNTMRLDTGETAIFGKPLFPCIPFLLKATVVALWLSPSLSLAQAMDPCGGGDCELLQGTTPILIAKVGKDGRNASTFRGPHRGSAGDAISFTHSSADSLRTYGLLGAIRLSSQGGHGGNGHNGKIFDTAGAVGGDGGNIRATIAGTVENTATSLASSSAINVWSVGGEAGTRRKGGDGGGDGGKLDLSLNDVTLRTASSSAAALSAVTRGGDGSSGFQAVKFRWSGSHGGDGGALSLQFSGDVDAAGSGLDLQSKGGKGGTVSGGLAQTSSSAGGTGGDGGAVLATVVGRSNGTHSSIRTSGSAGHAVQARSMGGNGGNVSGSTVFNGPDGGKGGKGGKVTLTLENVDIQTTGSAASGVVAQSDGGNGFWGGGSVFAKAGQGGRGGDGGAVTLKLADSVNITTSGAKATAVQAVSRGGGGSAGGAGGIFYVAGKGSQGGTGGAVTLHSGATVSTAGDDAHGLYAASLGGAAGDGGKGASIVGVGGQGGAGSRSSRVELLNTGAVNTQGKGSHAVLAQSVGGDGGTHNATGQAYLGGDTNANSPDSHGSTLRVENRGSLSTQGESAKGIMAHSIGGGGGNGGSAAGMIAIGGGGASSGNGGEVIVVNSGRISTAGLQGTAIHAQSVGGGGGNAGQSFAVGPVAAIAIGGSGGTAGDGGRVQVDLESDSVIETHGEDAGAIVAQSIGGGGGSGGIATSLGVVGIISKSIGGSGGVSGHGGSVSVSARGQVDTYGEGSTGIFAQSVGGGGGIGGDSTAANFGLVSVAIGGAGGSSGHGGSVTLDNQAAVTTRGANAHGALLQSVGGGGGAGGNAVGLATMFLPNNAASAAVSVGGVGGNGGNGGQVTAGNQGTIRTQGAGARALVAQSVGGGGGTGGSADAISVSLATGVSISVAVAVGRAGGNGGQGGKVEASNGGTLETQGEHSAALVAQSIGGGGGLAGAAVARAASYGANSFSGSLALGGKGGEGGDGGVVTVRQEGLVKTAGYLSSGILAQSVGGGGGNGGLTHGDARADKVALQVAIGRRGGNGGTGGAVTVKQSGSGQVWTAGGASDGIVAQSIGGGGGVGGALGASEYPDWPSPPDDGSEKTGYSAGLSLGLGGSGGKGGDAGKVEMDLAGEILTQGRLSHGVIAQSIGGGGGRAGIASTSAPGGDVSLGLTIGGSGGSGGAGGTVDVMHGGLIRVEGRSSTGLLAQSLGGGGGAASSTDAGQGFSKIAVNVALGGAGGAAGDGGAVNMHQSGRIVSLGGHALVAQSIGGGGGMADTVSAGWSMDGINPLDPIGSLAPAQGGQFALSVGGKGGAGGQGGLVSVTQSGLLSSSGRTAAGAILQSIGGGGGAGGVAGTTYEMPAVTAQTGIQVSLAVGGTGGAGGDGGAVFWQQGATGQVLASGELGDGIRLQSIGGGGGAAGGVMDLDVEVEQSPGDITEKYKFQMSTFTIGGSSGAGGKGGGVTAANAQGSLIQTEGNGGIGMLAQSVGGGGGTVSAIYSQGADKTRVSLGGGKGDGGQVSIVHAGALQTWGANAHGLLAQSLGGGGGAVRLRGAGASEYSVNPATASGAGGLVDIALGENGSIQTWGTGAFGILAQSIGGGGGYLDDGTPGIQQVDGVAVAQAGTGNGGNIVLNIQGTVRTEGDQAPAVFAQSIGGGGGLIAGSAGASAKGTGHGGKVSVTVGGLVAARGKDSSGIFAQSAGAEAGDIAIVVAEGGSVIGGKGDAAAIQLAGGAKNLVQLNAGAQVHAESGIALRTEGGATRVVNRGSLSGSLLLGQTEAGQVLNHGALYAGERLALAGGTLDNRGRLGVGGGLLPAAGELEGNLVQRGSGSYAPKIDFTNGLADHLTVTGKAQMAGVLAVQGINHAPGKTFEVLQAQSGLELAQGFESRGTAVFDYPFRQDGDELKVGIKADFTRHQAFMSEDQGELASYLGRKWADAESRAAAEDVQPLRLGSVAVSQAAGDRSPDGFVAVFDAVAQADDPDGYADVLDQVATDALQAPVAIMPLAHRMFLNRTMECPEGAAGGVASACLWANVEGNWLHRRSHHDDMGFRYDATRLMVGGQRPVANGWVLGGGLSYENSQGKTDDVSIKTNGHAVTGVFFARKEVGAWSYAGAVSLGYGDYDTRRAVYTGTGVVQPRSDWHSYFAGLRASAAYRHQMGNAYIKPAVDVDVMYQRVPGYSEHGGGAFDLAFDRASDVRAMLSPSVEIGTAIPFEGATLQPFLGVGLSWMPGNDWKTDAHLRADDSGDRFRLNQGLPSLFAEYRAGLSWVGDTGMHLKVEWRQRLANRYDDQAAELRFGMPF